MVRNGSPRVCFYFCPTERKSALFPLPRNGSERNSEGSLLLYLIHGTEFRVIFSSAEEFGTEFREFLFRGTAGIPSEITICSVYSVFRGIIFLSEIPNPSRAARVAAVFLFHTTTGLGRAGHIVHCPLKRALFVDPLINGSKNQL
jgi:hypothetical protein